MLFLLIAIGYAQVYPLTQSLNLTFTLALSNHQLLTVDIGSPLTILNIPGDSLRCNQQLFGMPLQCNSCADDQCQMHMYYPNNLDENVTLMQSSIAIVDYKNTIHEENVIYGYGSQGILGLGPQRGNGYPLNQLVPDRVSICLGYNRGFYTRDKLPQNTRYGNITYTVISGQYNINIQEISISGGLLRIPINVVAVLDTTDPYIVLPSDAFNVIVEHFQNVFQFKKEDRNIIRQQDNKHLITDLPTITIFLDQSYSIDIHPQQYLYRYGNHIMLAFRESKLGKTTLGMPFFQQHIFTLNQGYIEISEQDCQNSYQPESQQFYYYFIIIISIILGILFWKCRSTRSTNKFSKTNTELTHINMEDDDL